MIISNLKGGLGNQMFQYAAALALAAKHGVTAKVDLSFLKLDVKGAYTPRSFALDVFEKSVQEATEMDRQVFSSIKNSSFQRIKNKLFGPDKNTAIFIEDAGHYNKSFSRLPANTFLEGYFQSEKYFEAQSQIVRDNFIFSQQVKIQATEFEKKINYRESVSLHVRRGDYLSNKEVLNYHGVCSPEYYQKAIQLFLEKNKDFVFFVFSDDIQWCRENLSLPDNSIFVTLQGAASEMYLMTQCKHHIIANSSFSWWGAWLNNKQGKIVIAPKRWYANDDMNSPDIYCKEWLKL